MMGKKNSLLVFAIKLPSKAEEIFAKWNKYLKNPEKHNSELPGNIYHWFLLKFGYLGTLAHICPLVLPMAKAMSPHSSTLAWSTHPTPSHGWRSLVGCSPWGHWIRHNWATSLSFFTFMRWRRKWQPTPVFLPGESQGRGSLVGYRLWGGTVGHDWSDLAAAAVLLKIMKRIVAHDSLNLTLNLLIVQG